MINRRKRSGYSTPKEDEQAHFVDYYDINNFQDSPAKTVHIIESRVSKTTSHAESKDKSSCSSTNCGISRPEKISVEHSMAKTVNIDIEVGANYDSLEPDFEATSDSVPLVAQFRPIQEDSLPSEMPLAHYQRANKVLTPPSLIEYDSESMSYSQIDRDIKASRLICEIKALNDPDTIFDDLEKIPKPKMIDERTGCFTKEAVKKLNQIFNNSEKLPKRKTQSVFKVPEVPVAGSSGSTLVPKTVVDLLSGFKRLKGLPPSFSDAINVDDSQVVRESGVSQEPLCLDTQVEYPPLVELPTYEAALSPIKDCPPTYSQSAFHVLAQAGCSSTQLAEASYESDWQECIAGISGPRIVGTCIRPTVWDDTDDQPLVKRKKTNNPKLVKSSKKAKFTQEDSEDFDILGSFSQLNKKVSRS